MDKYIDRFISAYSLVGGSKITTAVCFGSS